MSALLWLALAAMTVVAHFKGAVIVWWVLPFTQCVCGALLALRWLEQRESGND